MDPVTRKEFEKVLLKRSFLAIIKQHKADRDNGKVLCPAMDDVVNIYSQILIDNPAPRECHQGGAK